MLTAIGLTKLNAGDLGDRIGVVGRLQWPCQQRLLWNGLGSLTRINAGRAEEQEFFDAGAARSMDDARFNEQIVIKEIARKSIVGMYAAHASGSQKNDLRTMPCHPFLDFGNQATLGLDRATEHNARARAGAP